MSKKVPLVVSVIVVSSVLFAGCSLLPEPIELPSKTPSAPSSPMLGESPSPVVESFPPGAMPTLGEVEPLSLLVKGGDDGAQAESGVEGIVFWESIVDGWSKMTSAWPLPVPAAYPFPEEPEPITGGTYYDYDYGLRQASTWWTCAVMAAAIDARDRGDLSTARYWLETLPLWGSTQSAAVLVVEGTDVEGGYREVVSEVLDGDWTNVEWHTSGCIAHTLR